MAFKRILIKTLSEAVVEVRKALILQGFSAFLFYSNSTKPNQFCLEIILCRIRGAFEYLMYPYYPAYMG